MSYAFCFPSCETLASANVQQLKLAACLGVANYCANFDVADPLLRATKYIMFSAINGKACLVTGGAGFLGRNLTKALAERGCRVRVLDRMPAPPDFSGAEWVQGDIQNAVDIERAVSGVEIVFHTIAMIETLTFAPQWFKTLTWNVNVEGTRALVEAAAKHGVKRFINTSSTSVAFGQQSAGGDESGPYTTSIDLYSSTKAEAERIVVDADTPGGMRTCSIRPGGIYGPGERLFMIGPVADALVKKMPLFVIGNGKSKLDYVYIDNLIDAQIRAAERLVEGSPVCGRAYFVTDDSPINPGNFSIALANNMNVKMKVVRLYRVPGLIMGWLWERFFQLTGKAKPQLTMVNVRLCTQDNFFSIAAARRDLGYCPECNIDEGLARTAVEASTYYASLKQ